MRPCHCCHKNTQGGVWMRSCRGYGEWIEDSVVGVRKIINKMGRKLGKSLMYHLPVGNQWGRNPPRFCVCVETDAHKECESVL